VNNINSIKRMQYTEQNSRAPTATKYETKYELCQLNKTAMPILLVSCSKCNNISRNLNINCKRKAYDWTKSGQ